jgi:hypothetical protein
MTVFVTQTQHTTYDIAGAKKVTASAKVLT